MKKEVARICTPSQINFNEIFKVKKKIIQIAVGLRQSYFLSESREMIYTGMYKNEQTYTPKKLEMKNVVNKINNIFNNYPASWTC